MAMRLHLILIIFPDDFVINRQLAIQSLSIHGRDARILPVERRTFGKTGLLVSVLGFGAGGIGDDSIDESESAHLLNSVVDAGINLIDTARSYGQSEERIGRHLKHRRNEIVLSTKIGYGIPGYKDWSPPIIEAGIEHALRTMQTDYIDIVHLHSCPLEVLMQEEIVTALLRAVDAGKIKVAAYSGDNEPFEWALHSGKFSALQTSLNICDQHAIASLQQAQDRRIGIIAKRAMANAPWHNTPPPSGDTAAAEYKDRWNKLGFDFERSESAGIALRFVAYLSGVHACLVGSTKLDHILENIKMIEQGPLPEEINSRIRSSFLKEGRDWKGQI